jgi:REP element-mobilizing transposase RayT
MARKVRIQYPGAIYHVMNRGDHGEEIFHGDADRKRFLSTLEECCQKTGWQVNRFCLMSNHFHLVVETPNANLVVEMKWLLGTYTKRFNGRHKAFLSRGRVALMTRRIRLAIAQKAKRGDWPKGMPRKGCVRNPLFLQATVPAGWRGGGGNCVWCLRVEGLGQCAHQPIELLRAGDGIGHGVLPVDDDRGRRNGAP